MKLLFEILYLPNQFFQQLLQYEQSFLTKIMKYISGRRGRSFTVTVTVTVVSNKLTGHGANGNGGARDCSRQHQSQLGT